MLKPFDSVTPIDATFQVRKTDGGHELWDPQFEVSLASGDPDWTFEDGAAANGVAECHRKEDAWFGESCEGRHVLSFSPPLPDEAVSKDDRLRVEPIQDWHW